VKTKTLLSPKPGAAVNFGVDAGFMKYSKEWVLQDKDSLIDVGFAKGDDLVLFYLGDGLAHGDVY